MIYYITKNKKLTNQDKAKILQKERNIRKIPYITYSKRYKKFYSYNVYTKKYKEFIKNITEHEINQMLWYNKYKYGDRVK